MAQVIFEIGSSDAYESLVIDLGDALRDPLPVLRLCRRIYMPTRDDTVSKVRLREFQRMLSERREEELGGRICPASSSLVFADGGGILRTSGTAPDAVWAVRGTRDSGRVVYAESLRLPEMLRIQEA